MCGSSDIYTSRTPTDDRLRRMLLMSSPPISFRMPARESFRPKGSAPALCQWRYTCPAHFGLTPRSEEHTSELQSLMSISYAVFCLKKNTRQQIIIHVR